MATYPKISLKKGREWQLKRGHAWLFSGGISQAPAKAQPGDVVDLLDTSGRFVARGYYNAACDIAVRVLSWNPDEEIDQSFVERRIEQAWALRANLRKQGTNVFRLVNAEGDFLPGFIVDYFAGTCVVQSHTAGADRLLPDLLDGIKKVVSPSCIVVRNDAGVRRREGLQTQPAVVAFGNAPDGIVVSENGLKFAVDPIGGQKTGFFTDQRDKRDALRRYVANLGQIRLLNCFSYSGSFAVYAHNANSQVQSINVDESEPALELARRNYSLNGISDNAEQFVRADAFQWLEQQAPGSFDVVILDPPAFAKSHKDKQRAQKAYARLNKLGLNALKEGGLLVTCSCSGPIGMDDFLESLRDAAGDVGRRLQLLESFGHGEDHPINVSVPESAYLKALFCRAM